MITPPPARRRHQSRPSGTGTEPDWRTTVERVCFLGRVRPDRLAEYRRRHADVWPEMLDALCAAGWSNYSLFLTDDGLVVGYLETDDYAAALARMAGTAVNGRWQADMAPYFADLAGQHPDQGFRRIDEIFHLA
jgi:L-rhamnose mutarotase